MPVKDSSTLLWTLEHINIQIGAHLTLIMDSSKLEGKFTAICQHVTRTGSSKN